jgi:hypothetical protein
MPKRNKLVIVTVSALDDLREGWRCQRKQTSGQSAGQSNLHPCHFHLPSFFEVTLTSGTDEGIQFWRYSAQNVWLNKNVMNWILNNVGADPILYSDQRLRITT